jgi:nicotinic acid mononucleotide adenylyltransferase
MPTEMQFMVTLPTEKFARRLHSLRWDAGNRLAFLSLSGSLSPVHTQHMRALEAARVALKRVGWTVVAGFLAPTPDEYLKGKLGIEAWGLEKRMRLCELACSESEWVDVCDWGEFRSYRLCAALREYLVRESSLKGRSLTGIELMGSDVAIRILDKNIADWDSADPAVRDSWYRGRVVCCLLRPGPNSAGEMEHIEKHTACRATDLGVELIVVEPESICPALQAVSSTEIRELLEAGDLEGLRNHGWLHPEVLAALAGEKSGL